MYPPTRIDLVLGEAMMFEVWKSDILLFVIKASCCVHCAGLLNTLYTRHVGVYLHYLQCKINIMFVSIV